MDRQLYRAVRHPVEKVLRRYGAGLADIAFGESLFEKGEESSYELMMLLNRGLLKAETGGTEELCFVAKGLMARIYVSQGEMPAARKLIQAFEETMKAKGKRHLLPNIKALQIRFALMQGDVSSAEQWMKTDAPDEKVQFYTIQRFCYLTKVRCYIQQERFMEALTLLGRLTEFAKMMERTYDAIESGLLTAIALFRMGGTDRWKGILQEALQSAAEFGFVRVFSEEGAAIKPLLEEADLTQLDPNYADRLIKAVRAQAVYYPSYLRLEKNLLEPLSKTEQEVLRLIVRGMKNHEIADFLEISPNTVKFHIKNLYGKMGVENRIQAVSAAKQHRLV